MTSATTVTARSRTLPRTLKAERGPHRRHTSTCLWAVPTIFLDAPMWWEAGERPWTCTRKVPFRPLDTTHACHACARWESRDRPWPATP